MKDQAGQNYLHECFGERLPSAGSRDRRPGGGSGISALGGAFWQLNRDWKPVGIQITTTVKVVPKDMVNNGVRLGEVSIKPL